MRLIYLTIAIILLSCINIYANDEANFSKSFELKTDVCWANLIGYAQTPAGGQPGTSDIKRPTFKELGINNGMIYDLSLKGIYKDFTVLGVAHFMRLSSSGVLKEPLITRRPFNAGVSYKTNLQYNWFQFGLGYRLTPNVSKGFCIEPRIEYAALSFDYSFDTQTENSISRTYIKGTARAGIILDYMTSKKLSLQMDLAGSFPIKNTPQIINAELAGLYRLTSEKSKFDGGIRVTLGLMYIDYEDEQELPNHIRFEAKPYIGAGFFLKM
jgi:hypothetical protein